MMGGYEKQNENARPVAKGQVTLGRTMGFGSSLSSAIAVAVGIAPDAQAAGGATVAIPFLLAGVVGLGLTSAWHILMGYAAHGRETYERIIAAVWGMALWIFGIACAGWFLVAIIGGVPALVGYRFEYLEGLKGASHTIGQNASYESDYLQKVKGSASGLQKTAQAEEAGYLSGMIGRKVSYKGLMLAAANLNTIVEAAQLNDNQRKDLLKSADEDIENAQSYIVHHDATGFQESVDRAANKLNEASKFDLVSGWAGIDNTGLPAGPARDFVEQTSISIGSAAQKCINEKKKVAIASYQPIDTKWAVIENPPPLAWIVAAGIESLPLIFLGLLLTVWREEEVPSLNNGGAKAQPSFPRVVS